jgi:hypothetical protein
MRIHVAFIAILLASARGFAIPGVSLQVRLQSNFQTFEKGQQLHMLANEMDSTESQLPFSYYFLSYCEPADHELEQENTYENLGTILSGSQSQITPYKVRRCPNCRCS